MVDPVLYIVFQGNGMMCPNPSEISFSHMFNYNGRFSDPKKAKLERTISDLCLLSTFRCQNDQECGLGRTCCPMKSGRNENCKLCIFIS